MHQENGVGSRGRIIRAITSPPFCDELGNKGWFSRFSRAQPHIVRHLRLTIAGWPTWSRPARVAFLSDFHTGSHSDDVNRLKAIIAEASKFVPDIVLFGGDYVNMQALGRGRVPPNTIAAILSRLEAPLGRFAILGNHDYVYGARAVTDELERQNIVVLNNSRLTIQFENRFIDIVGVPDAHVERAESHALLTGLAPDRPTIVLAHDPVWFGCVPAGPHLTLAGHTHGGQIRLPGVGIIRNASKAPLRWSYGLVEERGMTLYVTGGIGTSGIPLRLGVPPEYAILDILGD